MIGDDRTYDSVCALRAVTSTDGMTADSYPFEHAFLACVATRIVNEGINRVCYDVRSEPPGEGRREVGRSELNACSGPCIVVISNHFSVEYLMVTVNLRDAKAGFSSLVDGAIRGEFVTITRHGKPVAALVSVEAAEIARMALGRKRAGLVAYLRTFPGGAFERNWAPSRRSCW